MNFQLIIPIDGDKRVMEINQSLNGGEIWTPFYRVTYEKAAD